jgi:hemerythrin-like domain-containing protein
MDAFTLLMNDHKEASNLFQQLEATSTQDTTQRMQLFAQLKQALDIHAQLEETMLYPTLKEAAETREITLEAYDEHQEMKDLLAEMSGLDPAEDDWTDTLAELKDAVEHHVEEEENEMFPQAREVLGQQQLDDLGARMQQMKQQLLQQKSAAAG